MFKDVLKIILIVAGLGAVTFGIRYLVAERNVPAVVIEDDDTTQTVPIETESTIITKEVQGVGTSIYNTYVTQTEHQSFYRLDDNFYIELDELLKSYPQLETNSISLEYEDIESGYTFEINPEIHYNIASVVKAPYCMYVYKCALDGKVDINQKITYEEKYCMEGTGVIKDMEFGEEFTVEELIGYAIEESDNSAYVMLRTVVPEEDFVEYSKTLGLIHEEDYRLYDRQICCSSARIYLEAIYDFIEEDNIYSDNLKEHMLSTKNAMIRSQFPVVRKYGWYKNNFHDTALIYAPKPYILTILSGFEKVDDDTYQLFRDISDLIEKYSQDLIETDESINEVTIITTRETEEDERTEGTNDADELY